MATEELRAGAVVIEALEPGVYRLELPNGHRCVARVGRGFTGLLATGDRATVVFQPYDLSRGRIVEG
jgi:translation initiation factor IF-1